MPAPQELLSTVLIVEMKPLYQQLFLNLSILFLLTAVLPLIHARDASLQALRLPSDDTAHQAASFGFFNTSDVIGPIVLLQDDGQIDLVKTFVLNLPAQIAPSDVVFTQSCSDQNVLPIPGGANVLAVSSSTSAMNVTVSLTFDGMVGQANYTLAVASKSSNTPIDQVTIYFIIAGMTFYEQTSSGNLRILSGEENRFTISYEQAASINIVQTRQIKVFVQYPDGTSSASLPNTVTSLPGGGSLITMVQGAVGQVSHNSTTCPGNGISTLSVAGSIQFPPTCGCGFYWGQSGQLSYGINFQPNRAGIFRIFFTWPGLTANYPALSLEALVLSLNIDVTGTPPVTLVRIDPPETLLRPEGGELFLCDLINVDMHRATSFELRVDDVSKPFPMLPGSYIPATAPSFSSKVSFISQPGQGSDLKWRIFYQTVKQANGVTFFSYEPVAFLPSFVNEFTYDSLNITINSIVPSTGPEFGGTQITITGYFPGFHKECHGIFFSGKKLDNSYFVQVSPGVVIIQAPPRLVLGSAYEYLVTLRMGNAVSNAVSFTYSSGQVSLRISQIGTSEVSEGSFMVGDCSKPRFTAILSPCTSSPRTFFWTLVKDDESGTDILQTTAFQYVNSTSQAIELDSSSLQVGVYTLRVSTTIGTIMVVEEIMLLRQNITSIGAVLFHSEKRTITDPDVPLRFHAFVQAPECYTGNQTMVFEWSAFGEVQQYTSMNATGSFVEGALTSMPVRFGWEYIVPPDKLVVGTHTVTFKAWMAEAESITGQSISEVVVEDSPLVAVIRHGETAVTANHRSTLDLFASQSYDPNVIGVQKFVGLKYQWTCRQSQTLNFTEQVSSNCVPALIPTSSGSEFSVPVNVLQSSPSINYLQYTLVVRKEGRTSPATSLIVHITPGGFLPSLSDYSVSLENAQGVTVPWDQASHNDILILSVTSSQSSTWVYELLHPDIPEFFSSIMLLNHPAYYKPTSDIFAISGNTKPLALRAGALNPYTTYTIRVRFEANHKHEETAVVVQIRTLESPSLMTLLPFNSNGTTSTFFTAVSGAPTILPSLAYYFILTDTDGNQVCLGGCTGHPVTHFQVLRPGNFKLTGYLADSQGKAQLATDSVTTNITVHADPSVSSQALYEQFFSHGNDQSWIQQAQDIAISLVTAGSPAERTLLDGSIPSVVSRQEEEAQQLDKANYIADGAKRLYCSSYPNTYHGEDCVRLTYRLSKLRFLGEETLYSLMQIISCCVKKTPLRTIKSMIPWLPNFAKELNRLTINLATGGNTRRRLLQTAGGPANQFADAQLWIGQLLADVATSGKPDGFGAVYDIGNSNTAGYVSVVSATRESHMPIGTVNGVLRRVVPGPSVNELFYLRDICLTDLFLTTPPRRRIVVFQTTDNFVLRGFQDAPLRSNLVDKLYWTQVFERDTNGALQPITIQGRDYCFCWRLPVEQLREELARAVDDMPGLFKVVDIKRYQVDANGKGEVFNYEYTGSRTSEFNATSGWMEGCRQDIGLVSTTVVSKTSANIVADRKDRIFGLGGTAVVALVVGALLLVLVATIAAWIIAMRAMVDDGPVMEMEAAESYVERDVYGRGTGLEGAVRLQSE